MIEKIYIPTVRRADNQITYNNLPDNLKERVVMVVEPKDRHLYNYPCEYLEIPEKIVGTWTQLAETRLFIHKHAGEIKYCMADDDIIISFFEGRVYTASYMDGEWVSVSSEGLEVNYLKPGMGIILKTNKNGKITWNL